MPIYEYQAIDPEKACPTCAGRFEVIQRMDDAHVSRCPDCGGRVRRVVSWCRAAVMETSEEHIRTEKQIAEYEKEGMWSHAAELADKHSEKIKDPGTRLRALDDYKKAGYDVKTLEKHVSVDGE